MTHTSKMIEGAKPEAGTLLELQQQAGVPADVSILLPVFETSINGKKVYCCWSGGAIENGQAKLTLVGRAVLETLLNLPLGSNDLLVFQELKIGATPLKDKVQAALMRAGDGAKVCFIGDMQGELDGYMHPALNVVRETLKIGE